MLVLAAYASYKLDTISIGAICIYLVRVNVLSTLDAEIKKQKSQEMLWQLLEMKV